MSIKYEFKSVLRAYPRLGTYYPFVKRGQACARSKALRKKEIKAFVFSVRADLPNLTEDLKSDKAALDRWLRARFEKSRPSDLLLHLTEDALAAALIGYLYDNRYDEEREDALCDAAALYLSAAELLDFEELYLSFSQVERILTERNFLFYADCAKDSREHIKNRVYLFAAKHRIKDSEAAALLREDFFEKKQRATARSFSILLAALTAAFSAAVLLYCGPLPFLLLFLPILTLAYEIVCTAASFLEPARPILKLKEQKIELPVLVVITTLLTDEKDLIPLSGRLKRMLLQNPEKGISFGLLVDLPEAKRAHLPEDDTLIHAAEKMISSLNSENPGKFCLFLRGRVKSPAQGVYMGRERKRGALIELVRLIKGKPTSFRKVIADSARLAETAYILTLDADTEPGIGAVSQLYATMRHPANRPVIKNGIVQKGYGVLQPRMVCDVTEASKTRFSVLTAGGGGLDSYRDPVFDLYQTVFGVGAFCGKGMFDVEAFSQVIDGAFPDGRILSHDLLEGTRLRCGYLSEAVFSDGCPSNALSFFKRHHRWLRGDFQALPFALPRVPSGGKGRKREKNPISRLSKFMIVSNVVRALTPVSSLAALAFSTLLSESTCAVFLLFAFSYLLFPLLLSIVTTARFVGRRFYSTVISNIWQGLFRALFELAGLAYRAQLSLDALFRVLWRSLISGKKLLEWTTAGQSEKSFSRKGPFRLLLLYHFKALPSLLLSAPLLFLAHGGIVRVMCLLFLLFPTVCFLLGFPYKRSGEISPKQREQLLRYARESFSYFRRFVTEKEHFLPPDNYQEHPTAVLARRTSPTNIGLYLTSVVSMRDLGEISDGEMLEMLGKTVGTLEKLPKYKGHLYNWYSTENLEILGRPYISTVDSGNLALSFICVANALSKTPGEPAKRLSARLRALEDGMDFSFLFDRRRMLLSIGYDPVEEKRSDNCYDLLASEARSAYFYAIAKRQIPLAAWQKLGRPVTVKDGHLGIRSYSGTAFEFFMPALFLPVYRNTLLYEALCFALFEQAHDGTHGVWGRSESCYFAFDEQMNYQYKAFGSQALALDPTAHTQNVLAPYASFLALCISPALALSNLKRMEEKGLVGAHGFYEAVDFTRARVGRGSAVIRSYMSHHIGMSVTAIANACCGNIFVKRLLEDDRMDAACELLRERVPSDAPVSRVPVTPVRAPRAFPIFQGGAPTLADRADIALFCKNGCALCAAGDGRMELSFGETLLTSPLCDKDALRVALRTDEEILHTSAFGHFFFDGKRLGYALSKKKLRFEIRALPLHGCGWLFRFEGKSGYKQNAVALYGAMPFCTPAEYRTHPAFFGLFVESEYLENERILLFHKRPRTSKESGLYLALGFSDASSFSFAASADDLVNLPFGPLPCRAGPCRLPFLALCFDFSGETRKDLIVSPGKSRDAALSQIFSLRAKNGGQALYKNAGKTDGAAGHSADCMPERGSLDACSLLLQGIYGNKKIENDLPVCDIGDLWRKGLSGDDPIFTFALPDAVLSESQKKEIARLLRAQAYLAVGGKRCDLVFLYKEDDFYFSRAKRELEEIVGEAVGKSRLSGKGGVHLLCKKSDLALCLAASKVFVALEKDCIAQSLRKRFLAQLEAPAAPIEEAVCAERSSVESGFALPCGRFLEKGFAPDKARRPYAPFSQIYCSHQFGTLLTDRSLGFTWFRNSGEWRLTPFSGREREGEPGEQMLLEVGGRVYDLCAIADKVVFGGGCALYGGNLQNLVFELKVGVDRKLPVKLLLLKVRNEAPAEETVKVRYAVTPTLGRVPDGMIGRRENGGTVIYKRSVRRNDLDFGMYLTSSAAEAAIGSGKSVSFRFLLGSVNLKNDKCFYHVQKCFQTDEDFEKAFAVYARDEKSFFSQFSCETGKPCFDLLLDGALPRQILDARLYGRTGFYQPGGAYGFRDQLQDALSMLPYDRSVLRIQLLRAASHQFAEGDVQHWWHRVEAKPRDGKGVCDAGVRTHCSDDLLWLPYAFARYLDATGDRRFGERKIAYLSSPLPEDGKDRYEKPDKTKRKESLYFHCLRAIDLCLARRSPRGLVPTGSGDWNDGFSEVGGESVFTTQFLLLTLRAFLPCADEDDRARFRRAIGECESALEKCFLDGRYLRAFFPDGTPLGKKGDPFCEVDLLPQSFAVFTGGKHAKEAIETAFSALWDGENALFRLFAPAYGKDGRFPGYLAGYCPGFRENGGQYTHAAVWGAIALLRAGEHEKGTKILEALSPVYRCVKDPRRYALEPYALAGDISYADGHIGRGGWSHYTGAAGWYLTALLSELFGYRERDGYFTLAPRLSKALPFFVLTVRKNGGVYRICAEEGDAFSLLLDGSKCKNTFFFDGKSHEIKIVLAK